MSEEELKRLVRSLPIDAFFELMAEIFAIGPGQQVLEVGWKDRRFQWSSIRSGRVGRDEIERRRSNEG